MKKLIAILLLMSLLLMCGCQRTGKDGNPLKIAKNGTVTAQVNGEKVVFKPWKEAGLPTSGDYYLTKDVALTAGVELTGDLRLCLRGHNITVEKGAKFPNLISVPAGMGLTLFDVGENAGTVVAGESFNSKVGTVSCIAAHGKVLLEGINMDATNIHLDDIASGLCVYLHEGAEMTMNGGRMTGGINWNGKDFTGEEETPYMGDGGCLYVGKGAVCYINGATLTSGSAARGGNIFVAGDSEKKGKLVIKDSVITEGESLYSGGNIYVQGEFEMDNTTLSAGESYGHGGNIFVSGKLVINSGIITDGKADINGKQGRKGGNISINGLEADVYINNAKILNGKAETKEDYGGNIGIHGEGARSFLMENSELKGGVGHRGGNFYIGHISKEINPENLDYTLNNVIMSEGTTTYRGTNICLDSNYEDDTINLTMNQCQMLATEDSGTDNIAVGAGAEDITYCNIVMNGGKVTGGVLTIYGKGTLTTNGTEIPFNDHGGSGTLTVNP